MEFKFGKHRGLDVSDPGIELSYLEWCLGTNDKGENRITSDMFRDAVRKEVATRKGLTSAAAPPPPASLNDETGVVSGHTFLAKLDQIVKRVERLEKALYLKPPPGAGDAWEAPVNAAPTTDDEVPY